jgi:4-hydroxybenzoate polyprenyltransferase
MTKDQIRSGHFRRWLSCIRYREIFMLQGAPLLGAAFSIGRIDARSLLDLLVFTAASVLLVAHIFVFNDWAGIDADLNDVNRVAGVFAAKGMTRSAIRRMWVALLVLSLVLFGFLGIRLLVLALAIAALGLLYSLPASPAKGMPVLGSTLHLVGGMLHFLLGYSLFLAIDGRGIALSLFFGLVFAAGHLNQEVRDFASDGLSHIRTNAVAFGKARTFRAGLVVFTLAYAELVLLAATGRIPGWLGAFALLYPLHVYWSLKAVASGLSFESIRLFQAQYRALFAVVGLGIVVALVRAAAARGGL